MRSIVFCSIFALAVTTAAVPTKQPAGTVALGVGAATSTEVIVKINGKDTTVPIAGAPAGNQSSKVFLQCLVAHRVVRVSGGHVTLLDGTSIADHLSEFAQSQTTADPCELGKAAYTPLPIHVAAATAAAPEEPAAPAAPAKPEKKKPREVHISFGSSSSPAAGTQAAPTAYPTPPATSTAPAKQPATAAQKPAQPAQPQQPDRPPEQQPVKTPTARPPSEPVKTTTW